MWSVTTPKVILLRKISPRDSLLICSSVHSTNICEVTLCSMHCINGSLNPNVRCYLHTHSVLWMITHIPSCHLWHWLLLRLCVILQCAKLPQSCPTLCDLMDRSPSGCLSMGFSRQEYWSGLPFPTPGHLPDPGIEPASLASPALSGSLPLAPPGKQTAEMWHGDKITIYIVHE